MQRFTAVLFTLVTMFLIFLIAQGIQAYGSFENTDLLSKDSVPYGIGYGDWLAKWWQWYIGIPKKDHPNYNFTPDKCALHQEGPVWFLPNIPESKSTVVHNCNVPVGKAIAFVIETGECDLGMGGMKTDQDLIPCATKGNDYVTPHASVDGIKIENLNQYRVRSNFFNITIPSNNIYDAGAGTVRAFSSGYLIILKPLPPGKHTIEYDDVVNNPFEQQYNHAKKEIFNLLVTS